MYFCSCLSSGAATPHESLGTTNRVRSSKNSFVPRLLFDKQLFARFFGRCLLCFIFCPQWLRCSSLSCFYRWKNASEETRRSSSFAGCSSSSWHLFCMPCERGSLHVRPKLFWALCHFVGRGCVSIRGAFNRTIGVGRPSYFFLVKS